MRAVVFALLLAAAPAAQAEVRLEGPITQGGLVTGRAQPGAKVFLDGHPIRVAPDGTFLLGFGRDAVPHAELRIVRKDGKAETRRLAVAKREFQIQRIDGLPEKQVTPPPEDVERIKRENALIAQAREADGPETFFKAGFVRPVTGVQSGVFGSQRILNGKPRAFHNGVDIAADQGTPVKAMGDGRVAVAHQGMLLSGKTLLIDHGHGLTSVYIHLDSLAVKEGQRVAKGQAVGTVGKTGRATGPHLHWGVSLFATHLDPDLIVPEETR